MIINNKFSLKWISDCGRYTVFLSDKCYNKVLSIAAQYFPNEIGSSLIGSYSSDGYDAYIKDITPITIDSISTRYSFVRGIKGLKKYYKELLKKNDELYYLGEWHTHPNGKTNPSSTDDNNQFDIS
ncbi:MAG: Mov34/MPN/PAD-1 family protein, partial [Romboutsia sp.]|nr:Mov34/MPN/PAD-1 family protein [Romboutsia sp.]